MKDIKWAVLGTGVIANEMAVALKKNGRNIYAVGNRTYDKAVAFAEKYGIGKVYSDYNEMFTDPEVDVIYITTPHNTHIQFMRRAIENGKHILVEKSITLNSDELEEMLELADGVLFDLKHMDTARHKQLTGAGNDRILQNFKLAAASRVQLTVRYPMIPGQNDDDKNLEDMCRFLLMHGIDRLDVSPYHDYGCSKYEDLGMQATVFPKHTPEQLEQRLQVIRSFGITPIII